MWTRPTNEHSDLIKLHKFQCYIWKQRNEEEEHRQADLKDAAEAFLASTE